MASQGRWTLILSMFLLPWHVIHRLHNDESSKKELDPFDVHVMMMRKAKDMNISSNHTSITTEDVRYSSVAGNRSSSRISTSILQPLPNDSRYFNNSDDDKEEGFSACLMYMDDNHYLIEWLAYHYYYLPLKRLIVAIDPKSKTTPSFIFDRYRNNHFMNITEWNDNDFLSNYTMEYTRHTKNPIEWFRLRQRSFYQHCLHTLYNENRTWTAIIDTDEFIVPNWNISSSSHHRIQLQKSTVLAMLNHPKNQHLNYDHKSPCFPMHRQQFSAKDTDTTNITTTTNNNVVLQGDDYHTHAINELTKQREEITNLGFNAIYFMTLRYLWPIHRRLFPGKAMINLSWIQNASTTFKLGNHHPHKPIISLCKTTQRVKHKSPFVVNHYSGSLEQYIYRTDVRDTRTTTQFIEKALTNISSIPDTSGIFWLTKFVHKYGLNWSTYLLEGAGQIETVH